MRLDSQKTLTKDILEDSRAYVSPIAQNELDRVKQQALKRFSKSETLTTFKYK